MDVNMNLDQATAHVEKMRPLKLEEVNFKIKPNIKEQKRFLRPSLYKLIIIAEVDNQEYEFAGYTLDKKLISQLKTDPSRFLVGAEPPFLAGTNWPDSLINEVVQVNSVPLDALFITDGENVIGTIYNEEIPKLISWFEQLIH